MQSTVERNQIEEVVVSATKEAKRILATGDYIGARQFIEQALIQAPDDAELRQLGRVIAPPQARVSSSAVSRESLAANHQWLKEHGDSDEFRGQWIALRDGELVGNAENLDDIERKIGSFQGVFIKRVF